jgi:hypothetical protein
MKARGLPNSTGHLPGQILFPLRFDSAPDCLSFALMIFEGLSAGDRQFLERIMRAYGDLRVEEARVV